YERFAGRQLQVFSPSFAEEAQIDYSPEPTTGALAERRGLMINAAAHFPLAADDTDAILVGGILLNKNFTLIEHLREIIFPVGALPGDAEGMASIHIDDTSIAISRQRRQGQRVIGTRVPAHVADAVMVQGQTWLGRIEIGGESYVAGYEPIVDGDGQRIGMVGAGFPDAPYQKAALLILGMVAGLLALTMLLISILFLRTCRELTQRLANISATMTRVRQGERDARVGHTRRDDELGQLTRDFDTLLDTIASQDQAQRTALQTIADEASRRRALFEHERDGVVILNPDGSVFEANPKCAAMLGYSSDELARLQLGDWDTAFTAAELEGVMASVGPEGMLFETIHRRKNGSTYAAEVSVSRAQWGDRAFWLLLLRDITERKAIAAELAEHRINLERLVDQRTRELNSRSAQLDAIFALSPDGFVSFDAEHRVNFTSRAFLRMCGLVEGDVMQLDESAFSAVLAKKCLPHAMFPGVVRLRHARRKAAAATDAEAGGDRRQLIELAGPGNRVLEVGIRISEAENVSQILYFRDVTHETEVDRMKSE
ncbi:MAG: cache domain-containing protein, partial [Proteobacteria bacterium]|nr:cache domain-containing protein [Pseudomonadota bacterium]